MPITNPPIAFHPVEQATKAEVARLADWSIASGEMIPLDPTLIASHQLGTVGFIYGELVGYAALTVAYSTQVVEVGGLVVNPDIRRHGVGSRMIKHVMNRVRTELPKSPELILAFANEKSKPLFEKLGGEVVEDVSALPSEVWKQCNICPRLEEACELGKRCCDRVLDITNI